MKATTRNGLSLEERLRVIDWIRTLGQAGIDEAKLTINDLVAKSAAMIGRTVTEGNVRTILDAVKLEPYTARAPVTLERLADLVAELRNRVHDLEVVVGGPEFPAK